MTQCEPTRQSDEILLAESTSIVCLPITTSLLIVDLTSFPNTAMLKGTNRGVDYVNPLGQYFAFFADGGTVYYSSAATSGALTSIANTTQTSTVPQSAGATQFQIPSNAATPQGVQAFPAGLYTYARLDPGPQAQTGTAATVKHGTLSVNRFLALLTASGTATLRINVSSR